MARVTSAISTAVICAKSFFCSTSLSDTESRSSCSWACGISSRVIGCAKASCTRREAGGGFFLACSGSGTESSMCFQSSAARKNRSKACAKISACSWRLTKIASSVVKTSARLPISITCNAFMASITAPGPTGNPAARKARAKPTTLSAIRPVVGTVMRDSIRSSFRGEPTEPGSTRVRPYHWPSRQGPTWMARTGNPYYRLWLWIPGSRLARPGMTGAVVPSELILARRFLQDLLQRVALHPRDVVLVFQQRAECIADHLRGQRAGVEFGQRGGPVDGFGDARRFIEILLAQRLHEADHLLRQFRGNARHP